MSTPLSTASDPVIEYPDSDGQPMSDNTLQFRWIMTIQGNLDGLFRDNPLVFVAGDLLWYPVEGQPTIRIAPDTMVVFGRPKGYRGSYQQWREGGVGPKVAFEVLSPGNRPPEMDRKLEFYERHGIEEYYLYDPDGVELAGWIREGDKLVPIPYRHGWVSPRLGIRFDLSGDELVIYRPDGRPFLTFVELMQQGEAAEQLAEHERLAREQAQRRADRERSSKEKAEQRAEAEQQRAESEKQRAENERAAKERAERRAAQLQDRLRQLGIDEPERDEPE